MTLLLMLNGPLDFFVELALEISSFRGDFARSRLVGVSVARLVAVQPLHRLLGEAFGDAHGEVETGRAGSHFAERCILHFARYDALVWSVSSRNKK